MARDFPEKYDDPLYAELDTKTEQKLGLPVGLLSSVRTNGEKSNHSATNSDQTFSSYQFIPATRKAILDKYGIDVSLSPENASEGAGLLLKEGLARNKGDASQAVGEYIGGLDRNQWGKTTQAYINRVMTGQNAAKTDALSAGFAKFMADNPAVPASSPSIQPQAPASQPAAPKEDKLAAGFGQWLEAQKPKPGAEAIPVEPGANTTPTGPAPETSIGEKIIGAGEAALSTGTGLFGGAAGLAGGAVKGIGQAILDGSFGTPEAMRAVEQSAAQGAQALTYEPRTPSGRAQTEAIGEVMQSAIPAMPLAGELAGVARAGATLRPTAQAIPPVARSVAATGAEAARTGVEAVASRVNQAIGREPASATGGGARGQSIGAASVPQDVIRATKAENLDVPITLTRGAETRDAAQLAFEKEQMKGPQGAPLRARAEENNLQTLQNFDSFIDKLGSEAPDISATGSAVTKALAKGYKETKNKVNVAYQKARAAGELEAPVDLTGVIQHLNEAAPEGATAPLITTGRNLAVKLGIAREVDGQLVPFETAPANTLTNTPAQSGVTLRKAELFRQAINRNTDFEPTNIRQSAIIKGLVDSATEGKGGELYAKARSLRTQQARKYENRAIVARLINNRRGMDDPQVAVDQVFQKSILNGSPEEITFLKRVLNTSGKDGQQAWRELQGATAKYLRDEATKGMGMDSADNPLVSPAKLHQAVNTLDKNGRLEIVLGKQIAERVRDLNDVVRYVSTVPPGTLINNSGTAGTLLAAMGEMAASGALFGLPVPVLTTLRVMKGHIADKRMQAKIQAALNAKPVKTGAF